MKRAGLIPSSFCLRMYMPTFFKNYAGYKEKHGIDSILDKELLDCGINLGERHEFLRGKMSSEIDTVTWGKLGAWHFKRYWRYWVAEGPGIPPEDATKLWQNYGDYCRVKGHACGPSPLEETKGFAVGSYHVDTFEGLKALADLIKEIYIRNGNESYI